MPPADLEEMARMKAEKSFLDGEAVNLSDGKQTKLFSGVMKCSAAADDLIKYTKGREEPFSPDFGGNNPWLGAKAGGGGGCAIL